MEGNDMKKIKKLCGAVLIAGFMLPQIAMGSIGTAEAASGTWKQDSKGWWYSYSDGTYAKSTWLQLGGKWYYFNANGYMVKNWQNIGKKWYFFGSNGAMRTGWQLSGGKWYFLDGSGAMKTGWLSSGGKWYYFNSDGSMVTGTKTIGGKSYTFGSDGAMKEGSLGSSASSLAGAKVGDIVTFGSYEQDGKTSNGKEAIEWIVLDKKSDGSLTVISKYALDCQPYNSIKTSVTWETCTLRTWLNSTFLNTAFNDSEKAKILSTTLVNSDNLDCGTKGGNTTNDKVFLISADEAKKYFKTDNSKDNVAYTLFYVECSCDATAYAKSKGAGLNEDTGLCSWWMRTPGYDQHHAALGLGDNYIFTIGYDVDEASFYTVRPAMTIKP